MSDVGNGETMGKTLIYIIRANTCILLVILTLYFLGNIIVQKFLGDAIAAGSVASFQLATDRDHEVIRIRRFHSEF